VIDKALTVKYFDENFDPSLVIDTNFSLQKIEKLKKGVYEKTWEQS